MGGLRVDFCFEVQKTDSVHTKTQKLPAFPSLFFAMSDAIEEVPPEIWTHILNYVIRRASHKASTYATFNRWCVECALTCRFFALIILPWISEVRTRTAASVEHLRCWQSEVDRSFVSGHTALLVHTARILPQFNYSLVAFEVRPQRGATTALILLACAYAALHANRIVYIVAMIQGCANFIFEVVQLVLTNMGLSCRSDPSLFLARIELPNSSLIIVRPYFIYPDGVLGTVITADLLLIDDPHFMTDCVDAEFLTKIKTVVAFGPPAATHHVTQSAEGEHPWSSLAPSPYYKIWEPQITPTTEMFLYWRTTEAFLHWTRYVRYHLVF